MADVDLSTGEFAIVVDAPAYDIHVEATGPAGPAGPEGPSGAGGGSGSIVVDASAPAPGSVDLIWVDVDDTSGGVPGSATDHGALTGLEDPDHPIAAVQGLQAALDGKAGTVHVHALDDLTDVDTAGAGDGQSLVYTSGNWGPATVTSGGGVTDHGLLTGLTDDDHTQYYNQTRGDARYSQTTHNHSGVYDPAGTASSAVTAHVALSDPHTQYLRTSEVVAGANISVDTSTTPGSAIIAATVAEGPEGPMGPVGPPGGVYLWSQWTFNQTTTAPPVSGGLRLNGTTFAATSLLWISETDRDGLDRTAGLNVVLVGDQVMLQSAQGRAVFNVTSVTDSGTYRTFGVTPAESSGTRPAASAITTVYIISAGSVANLPAGGAAGQVLSKNSATDYDTGWTMPSTGGVSLVVAASTASAKIKAGADYVCDGTADNVEIQAAITASAGGIVQLSAGTFTLAAGLTITSSNTVLAGAGFETTVLSLGNAVNANVISITGTGTKAVAIRDLAINGNGTNNTTGHGISINTPWSAGDSQHLLSNLDITYVKQDGVVITGDTRVVRVFSVRSRLAGRNGFNVGGTDHQFLQAIADACGGNGFLAVGANVAYVQCKAFWCASTAGQGYAGFRVESTNCNYFTACEAQDNDEHGFRLVNADRICLTGCIADSNGKRVAGSSGLSVEDTRTCSIIGGQFWDRAANATRQAWGITLSGTTTGVITSAERYYGNITGTYRDISSGSNERTLDTAAADAQYVNVAGDTMTGDLNLDAALGTTRALNLRTGGVLRWQVGKNPDADFVIARYDDAGNWVENVLHVDRANSWATFKRNTTVSGDAQVGGALDVIGEVSVAYLNSTGGGWFNDMEVWNVGTPTVGTSAANRDYADTKWTMWSGGQAAYNAIGTKDPTTLYVITGA